MKETRLHLRRNVTCSKGGKTLNKDGVGGWVEGVNDGRKKLMEQRTGEKKGRAIRQHLLC